MVVARQHEAAAKELHDEEREAKGAVQTGGDERRLAPARGQDAQQHQPRHAGEPRRPQDRDPAGIAPARRIEYATPGQGGKARQECYPARQQRVPEQDAEGDIGAQGQEKDGLQHRALQHPPGKGGRSSVPRPLMASANLPLARLGGLERAGGCRIAFGALHRFDPADPASLEVGLPPLADAPLAEHWLGGLDLVPGRHGEAGYLAGDGLLLGHLLLDEAPGRDMAALASTAYERLLACVQDAGFPHLLRVWHVLPAITGVENGVERYRAFSLGRHAALQTHLGDGFEVSLPAASAVGGDAPGLLVSFLAGKAPGVQVENPRQTSAFRYPLRYGPKSPAFSRALRTDEGALILSGTASIVGHESRHPGDPTAQTQEIVRNLAALGAGGDDGAPPAFLRVYVRRENDWPAIEAVLRQAFGAALPLLPLRADICRPDLLVEAEGLALPSESHPCAT